jgi:uncharacterized membrane protein YdbT with pleckstrin-like domain
VSLIYRSLAALVERLLAIPPSPGAPPGDEGTARVFRASPRFYLYRLLGWGVRRCFSLVITVSVLMALTREGEPAAPWARAIFTGVLAVFALQTLVAWVALRLDYEKRWYLVTDRSLRIRQGVVGVSEMTITFANIQNLSISQGPLQRLFGISDLRVDTAGGAAATGGGEQPGLRFHTAFFQGVDNAEQIRELVQQRLRRVRDAGLGDPDDESSSLPPAAPEAGGGDARTAMLIALRELRDEAHALHRSARARD